MNSLPSRRPAPAALFGRNLLMLAACLMLLFAVPGKNERIYAAAHVEEYFNLPIADIWTSGATTSKLNVHFYKITLKTPGLLTVDIENMKSGQIFFLADEEKNRLGQITSGTSGGIWGSSETKPYAGSRSWYLEKGTYYVEVKPWDDGEYFGKYKVKATFKDAQNMETEPNQEAAQAVPVSFGKQYRGLISIQDHVDWYSFTVDSTDQTALMFRVHCTGINWKIYKSDLTIVKGMDITEWGGSLSAPKTKYYVQNLVPGTYYLRAVGYEGDNFGLYDFMLFRPVSSITLTCPDTLLVGENQTAQAEIYPADASFPKLIWTSSNPAVATVSDTGVITPKSAGTVTIKAEANDGVNNSASKKVKVVVPELEIDQNKVALKVGEKATIKVTRQVPEDGHVVFGSDNYAVATVNSDTGEITAEGAGTCTIQARLGSLSRTVNVTVEKSKQTISVPKTSYKLAVSSSAFRLNAKNSSDESLTYTSSNTKVVTVSAAGRVVPKGIGTAKITITAPETKNYISAAKTVTVTVNPAAVKIKSAVNVKGGKLKLTWKAAKKIDGYEIEYSTNSKFKSGKKSVDIGSPKKTSRVLSGLKKGKTYYVRIRAYKDAADGKTYVSAWNKKSVKIRK